MIQDEKLREGQPVKVHGAFPSCISTGCNPASEGSEFFPCLHGLPLCPNASRTPRIAGHASRHARKNKHSRCPIPPIPQKAGGPWYSWNAVGTTQSPGPGGYTCTTKANYPEYCYTSCDGCGKHNPQCDWTTCEETGPTPTGTGLSNVGGFIPSLYDTLESQLCVDTSREYASGESNGGMMTY